MTIDMAHPYGSIRTGVMVIGISLVGLVVIGVTSSTPVAASPSGIGSKPADAIVAAARAAMSQAGSVTAVGRGSTDIPGVGKVTITESDYTDSSSGDQVLKTVSDAGRAGTLPAATTLDVDGHLYVNANTAFWTSSVEVSTAQAALVAGAWVQIPQSSSLYAPAAADLTMPTLTKDMFDGASYHKGKIQTIDGTRAVKITYTNLGTDSGSATCYVAVGGKHLPVAVIIGGLSLRLESWGKSMAVTAPSGAIPLPDMASPSGAAVTA